VCRQQGKSNRPTLEGKRQKVMAGEVGDYKGAQEKCRTHEPSKGGDWGKKIKIIEHQHWKA